MTTHQSIAPLPFRVWADRSRAIDHTRCPRLRHLRYHSGPSGMGMESARKDLPLAVGGAVHSGIEVLLRAHIGDNMFTMAFTSRVGEDLEDQAVRAALADFSQYNAQLELDQGEQSAIRDSLSRATAAYSAGEPDDYARQLQAQAESLGMTPAELEALRAESAASHAGQGMFDAERARKEYDAYLFAEQSALVEAMVRAYARRRLRPLLEQYEVLEVEREDAWRMCTWVVKGTDVDWELWWMSRPDALLRERATNALYILSLKTAANWDDRKERDTRHDMQGLSEGVGVERRLGEWWQLLSNHPGKPHRDANGDAMIYIDPDTPQERTVSMPWSMVEFLRTCSAPPRVLGIRYEFLLKGERWKDKELSARLGIDVRSQRSHLIRAYTAVSTPKKGGGGYVVGGVCWSWDYRREDGTSSSLAWQNWKSQPAWGIESAWGSIKAWIDALDATVETQSAADSTVGLAPRSLGWGGPAQRLGYTTSHPLDAVFVPPIVVYRSEDDLRDWFEQTEASERRIAEAEALIAGAESEDARRSLLNVLAPQNRSACVWPSQCAFDRDKASVCWGPPEVREKALGNGYKERVPNHPQETEPGERRRP